LSIEHGELAALGNAVSGGLYLCTHVERCHEAGATAKEWVDAAGEAAMVGGGVVAGGWVDTFPGVHSAHIVLWSGSAWIGMGLGMKYRVKALVGVPDGGLMVGGNFTTAGGNASVYLARWGCAPCYANCDGSTTAPILNVADFICFLSKFAEGCP